MAQKTPLDLSVYLVTDSTPAILKGRDICAVVEEALKGGQKSSFFPVSNATFPLISIQE